MVDTRALKAQENPIQVKCEVRSKSGKVQQAKVEKLDDGTHLVTFKPTEKGSVLKKFKFCYFLIKLKLTIFLITLRSL